MAVPKNMQGKYDEIAPLITAFCDEKLNDDYEFLCLKLLEKLCRKRPSPLLGGRARTWAAGIVYAIGSNNFIFDKKQELNLTASELAAGFSVAPSTASSKAAEIRNMFDISYFNIEWLLPNRIRDNPMVWMVMVNDMIVDVRKMPLEIQAEAFKRGLIPYIPALEESNNS